MTRSLTAAQAERVGERTLRPLPLVEVAGFADREGGIVSDRLRFSTLSTYVDVDSDGSREEFLPLLFGLQDATFTMNHLPQRVVGEAASALRHSLRIDLLNRDLDDGRTLYRALTDAGVEGARVRVWEVLLAEGESDLRPASEPVLQYEGEVVQASGIEEDAFTLECQTERLRIPWVPVADTAKNDPADVGTYLPLPYGLHKRMPLVGWDVGAEATLSAEATASDTSLELTDASKLPTSGSAQLGGERVSWTGVSGDTLTGVTRGVGGTTATSHKQGEVLKRTDQEHVFIASMAPIAAVDRVYAHLPRMDQLTRVDPALYTVDTRDTAVFQSLDVATVRFTQANLEALLARLLSGTTGSQGSDSVSHTSISSRTQKPNSSSGPAALRDDRLDTGHVFNDGDSVTLNFDDPGGTVVRQQVQLFITLLETDEEITASSGGASGTLGPLSAADGTDAWRFIELDGGGNSVDISFDDVGNSGKTLAINEVRRLVHYAESAPSVSQGGLSVSGPSITQGLRLFADVQGSAVPLFFDLRYSFDAADSWQAAAGQSTSLASDAVEGASSRRVTVDENLRDPLEEGSTGRFTQGSSSVRRDSSDLIRTPTGGEDWSGEYMLVDCYVESGEIAPGGGVRVELSSASDFSAGFRKSWVFHTQNGLSSLNRWHTLIADVDAPSNGFDEGSFDPANVNARLVGPQPAGADMVVHFDNWRTVPKANLAAQTNATAGAIDLTAHQTRYRVAAKDLLGLLSSVEVFFSNTAATGVSKPAAYRSLNVTPSAFVWVQPEVVGSDTGSPSLGDVETIGVRATVETGRIVAVPLEGGNFPATVPLGVQIDDLEAQETGDASGYSVSAGVPVENVPDILRHLLLEVAEAPASIIDESAFSAALSNVGSNAHAFDARDLGRTFEEVVTALGAEGRVNVVLSVEADGAKVRPLAADGSYSFPAAVRDLTGLHQRFRGNTRRVDALASRFKAAYSPTRVGPLANAQPEEPFEEALVAQADRNDVSSKVATSMIATAEARIGRRTREVRYATVYEQATAEDVFGYDVRERTRFAATGIMEGVPWPRAYDLQIGDIVTADAPWLGVPLRWRIVQKVKRWRDGLFDLNLVEVP